MISVENGTVKVKGTRIDLMADLTIIMRSMLEQEIIDEDLLAKVVAMATMSEDELKGADKSLREFLALASMLFGDFK